MAMLQLDVRELVRGTASPEVAMLEKKSRLDLGDHPILGGVQRNKVSCAHGTVGAPR